MLNNTEVGASATLYRLRTVVRVTLKYDDQDIENVARGLLRPGF